MAVQRYTPTVTPRACAPVAAVPGLTRAEERALRRSMPLTAVQLRDLRLVAAQRASPQPHV